MNYIDRLCGRNTELLNVKPGGTYSYHCALSRVTPLSIHFMGISKQTAVPLTKRVVLVPVELTPFIFPPCLTGSGNVTLHASLLDLLLQSQINSTEQSFSQESNITQLLKKLSAS
jgi:hypothetical protein